VSEAISDVVRRCRAGHLGGFSEEVFRSAYFVDELTRVTRAVEEGKGATGTIAFVATDGPKKRELDGARETQVAEPLDRLAEFDKPIRLNDHKHVVKSLQLARWESAGCIWADHEGLRGVLRQPPQDSLVARFSRGIADLSYAGTKICRIVGGEACYVLKEPKDLLAPFLDCGEECLDTVALTIQSCREQRHGATLVLTMASGNPVLIASVDSGLTTQKAADLLNVSRLYLAGLLDQYKIPYRNVGRYRRVKLQDIMTLKKRLEQEEEQALNELLDESQQLAQSEVGK
jgi:excisionase family DNA binding protein